MYSVITLAPGKEANVAFHHPWIFSGAILKPVMAEHGELVQVLDKNGKCLGTGTYSASSSIAIRVMEFGPAQIDKAWFLKRFKDADARRTLMGYGPKTDTTGYRLIFGEADGIPGLVVDRYNDVLVIQIGTAGMDKMRDIVRDALVEVFAPKAIVERSTMPSRREENLPDASGVIFGEDPGLVTFKEAGKEFIADVVNGQKTGFFCDQKETRAAIQHYAAGRANVANLFSYSGSAGIAALLGGAEHVHNVDASAEALALCMKHAELHGFDAKRFTTEEADLFQWLGKSETPAYDMVILDPPALIKSKADTEEGKKAYHFLNRAAMRLTLDNGILVTSSCSHFMSEEDLAFTLRRASVQAGVKLDLLAITHQSPDHPASVYFPEASYLKTFIFRVSR